MKLTYNNTTIDFFDFDLPKQMLVSLSGGCDSSAAAYLTSKHFPSIELIPFTSKDQNAPKDAEAADQIVKWLQKEFPNNVIHDLEVYEFNDRTEEFVTFKECKRHIKQIPRYAKLNITQMSKVLQLNQNSWKLLEKYPGAIRLDGMTRNPPAAEMKKLNFYEKAERRRDLEQPEMLQLLIGDTDTIYKPWINVDKKFVADIFKQNNLTESLFPLTRSCVGTARQTDNFTRECHQCFWCHEKKWAFDLTW